MPLDEPSWWYGDHGRGIAACLAPLASVYGWAARRRYTRHTPYRSRLPVICVGNLTAGGTGKTPLAIHLCEHLRAAGRQPVALTRGYGGRRRGPHWVTSTDTADDVGDEALLLARTAPTLVSRDRAEGARVAEAKYADSVLVMDDGLQNPALAKNLSIVMVDGRRGLGNGRVIPAGPLRAPLQFQLALADAIVVSGRKGAGDDVADWLREHFAGPILRSVTTPVGNTDWLRGARVVAWAGIGSPQRFFSLVADLGAEVVETVAFRDHHRLHATDAERLLMLSGRLNAQLVTTAKDMARLAGHAGKVGDLAAATRVLQIKLVFPADDASLLHALMQEALARHATGWDAR